MMKKLFYGLTLLAALASCSEDYTDWALPQTNPEEAAKTVEMTVKPVADIDLATAPDSVQLFTPEVVVADEAVSSYTVNLTTNPASDAVVTLVADAQGRVASADLQAAVVQLYGAKPDKRSVALEVVCLTAVGSQTFKNVGTTTVNITPKAPHISDNYYVVGATYDWAESAKTKVQKFSHSATNVYDDPIFTITIKASQGDTWFAIGDDEALDAITNNGDWSKLLGTTGGNGNQSMTGSLAARSELSDDGSICMPGSLGADFFKITLNMMEYTYTIEPVIVAAQYYVVGGIQGWSDKDKTCIFTPESKYVLSYTTKWSGAWDLKFWNVNDFGNWDKAYGCAVDGDNSASGTIIGSNAQAISAPSAEFYTFTINMETMTYTWTKLDNQAPTEYTNISLIGEFNGWGGDFELKQVAPHNWHAVFVQESAGMLKYRANHDWSVNWGFGSDGDWNVADGINKIGTNGGGNIYVPAGTYDVYLNDITNSMLFVAQ
jgi:hypothetical protein